MAWPFIFLKSLLLFIKKQRKYRQTLTCTDTGNIQREGGQCYCVTEIQKDLVPHWITEKGEETWGQTLTDPQGSISALSALLHHSVCDTPVCKSTLYIDFRVCVSCLCLTCRTGLVCTFGKLVGLFSHRIRSLWDRHLLLGLDLPQYPSKSLFSSWPSSSRPKRRWWWSRYAALRDRKRANHLWRN